MLAHIDASDSAFADADACAPIAGDYAAQKFEEIGIVAHDEHVAAVGILFEQFLETDEVSVRRQRGADLNLSVVTHLRANELGSLHRALKRAGDNQVDLNAQRTEHASH